MKTINRSSKCIVEARIIDDFRHGDVDFDLSVIFELHVFPILFFITDYWPHRLLLATNLSDQRG